MTIFSFSTAVGFSFDKACLNFPGSGLGLPGSGLGLPWPDEGLPGPELGLPGPGYGLPGLALSLPGAQLTQIMLDSVSGLIFYPQIADSNPTAQKLEIKLISILLSRKQ